jgi:hypothetical protein
MARNLCRVLAVAAALAAAAGAQVWPPRLVASFAAPPGAIDVAFEHGPLYALVDGTPPTVYSLNPYNGSITGSFTVPIPSGARGITYEAHAANWIWVSNRINRHVYRLTTAGSLASSFICPVGKPYALGYATHLPRHGAGLFAACREENQIVRFNVTTGSVLSSFEGPSTAIVTFDDFFAGDRFSNSLFWDYYGTWQVMDNLPARPLGVAATVAWETDPGADLYVLCNNGYAYRYYGWTAVAPASLGRVKALYR